MAAKFKSIFDVAEEKAYKRGYDKGIAIGKVLVKQGVGKLEGTIIVRLIELTQLDNAQIAYIVDASISLVEAIRLEVKKAK
jgi:hypothetical protein